MTRPDAALPADAAAQMPAAPPPAPSVPALLAGLILKPRTTFTYLRDYGGRAWLWPLWLALGLTLVARLIAVPIERARAQAALEELQRQIAEQMPAGGDVTFGVPAGGAGLAAAPTGLPGSNPLFDYGLPVVGVAGLWLLATAALLALAWVFGGRPRPAAVLRMSAWGLLVPIAARSLVAIAVMLATGRVPAPGLASAPSGTGTVVSSAEVEEVPATSEDGEPQITIVGSAGGPGTFGTGPAYVSLVRASFLASLDLYTVWGMLLLTIGLAVTAGLGWVKAGLATALYFGLSLALAALPPIVSFWLMSLSGAASLVPLP